MSLATKAALYPVKSAKYLLSQTKRQLLLAKIQRASHLESPYFEDFYQSVIEQFAEFVQALPIQKGGKEGGLLDYGLIRSHLILKNFYEDTPPARADTRNAYALFTAALLRDVGKVMSQQKIMISDTQGEFIDQWRPLTGSLLNQAEYYKVRFMDDRWIILGHQVTPFIAKQLMPSLGFHFIAEDYDLLQKWLALLTRSGGLEADSLTRQLELVDDQLENELNKLQLPPLPLEILYPEDTVLGEAFLDWLNENLLHQKIPVNQTDSWVHALQSGEIFLDKQLFNLFCQQYARRTDWITVLNQFNRLGLTKLQGQVNGLSQLMIKEESGKNRSPYFLNRLASSGSGNLNLESRKTMQGVLMTEPGLLNIPSGEKKGMSALKLQGVVPNESNHNVLSVYLQRNKTTPSI